MINDKKHGVAGFTLTEVAIVLGILGIILAAVWLAANAVYSNQRLNKASTQILAIEGKLQTVFQNQNAFDTAATTASYITMGLFPADMVQSATVVQNGWRGAVTIKPVTVGTIAGAGVEITYDGLPADECTQLILSLGGIGRQTNLIGIKGGPAGSTYPETTTSFPVSAATAAGYCPTTSNAVTFTFSKR